jgi:DNA-binding transcriptional regulator YdaS (Cro superfamily)
MKRIDPPNPAIAEAYDKAGGRKVVQEALGVTKASLSDWLRAGTVPAGRCAQLEKMSGVSRRRLNPEFDWGPVKAPRQMPERLAA